MEKDIFDRIMQLPGFRIFNGIYKKYKEVLLYLFFGGLTTVISIISYAFFNVKLEINELLANIISWIISVSFAYFTNRIWVFHAPTDCFKNFVQQVLAFYGGRILTLFIEEGVLLIFITYLHFNSILVKVIAQIVVIVFNYVISKIWVFKNN